MSLRSNLGRVKGLGSAKQGVHHWRVQRLSALALIPLSLWFVTALMGLVTAPHSAVVAWLAQPHITVLLLALVTALFWHAQLGLQVVIEDYIHRPGRQIAAQLVVRAGAILGALAALVAILKISLGIS
ncbi:MAG: succinate dehydrogenase, hydrophobic membrane anchor protein [Gammaproteobacteria bacterium]|nr:succinate dehydrogenase, hydrophobic membrane anchor protein [Gammaproteobacteria bacterium]